MCEDLINTFESSPLRARGCIAGKYGEAVEVDYIKQSTDVTFWPNFLDKEENKKEPRYFVNPVIKNKDPSKATYEEGCLSVPNQFAEIDRPSKCDVEYLDYNGEKQLLKADGLLATCIQHEMDHLEGILFIDYLSKLKKSMIIKKLSKLKSNTAIL